MPLPVDPFDVSECLFNGLSLIAFKARTQLTGYTSATDTVTKTTHGHVVGDALAYVSGTGWTGLTAGGFVYVVEVPTSSTFKVSATRGGTALTLGTSTAGIFRKAYVFGSKLLTDKNEESEAPLKRPGSDGVNYEARTFVTERTQSWTFDLDEVKRLPKLFSGGLAGRVIGDVTLYMPDPDDESGKCAMVSEEFACTVTRDSDMAIGNSEHSKATLKIKSNKLGVVEFETDVTL